MLVQHFKTEQEMSDHAFECMVQDGIRLQKMSPKEYSQWIKTEWGEGQRRANSLFHKHVFVEPFVIHFATHEEKNEFDEEFDQLCGWQIRQAFERNAP